MISLIMVFGIGSSFGITRGMLMQVAIAVSAGEMGILNVRRLSGSTRLSHKARIDSKNNVFLHEDRDL